MQNDKSLNLCKLSIDDQQAIEQDKALWLTAHNLIKNNSPWDIKEMLKNIPCEIERNDMRNRLNQTWKNNKITK